MARMSATERRAVKQRELLNSGQNLTGVSRLEEPAINPLDYKVSLLKALNYYNVAFDDKEKRKWVMKYVGKANVEKFSELPDHKFHTLGAIVRLIQRGQPVDDNEVQFVGSTIRELETLNAQIAVEKKQADKPKAVKVVRDRNTELLTEVLVDIDFALDGYVTDRIEPDFSAMLKSKGVPAPVAKQIPLRYASSIAEVREAIEGKDKQLVEGYSHFKKTELKKFLKILESIEPACEQQVVSIKVDRPVRIRKEKPAAQVVAKVKYQKECPELGLKSVSPVGLQGASEAWIFNTKYRTLQVYRAESKLTVKGTSLMGYDVSKSSCKKVRKPETVKDLAGMTKMNIARTYNSMKTAEQAVNGRINENCIILKVFS